VDPSNQRESSFWVMRDNAPLHCRDWESRVACKPRYGVTQGATSIITTLWLTSRRSAMLRSMFVMTAKTGRQAGERTVFSLSVLLRAMEHSRREVSCKWAMTSRAL